VLGVARGGVPVADAVATELGASLDMVLVRKLGALSRPEVTVGAIGEGGVRVVNNRLSRSMRLSDDEMRSAEFRERLELDRLAMKLRGDRPRRELDGRTVIVVDDGIATGATARAACAIARRRGAARIVLAALAAPLGWQEWMVGVADDYLALETVDSVLAISRLCEEFGQTTDEEVIALLDGSRTGAGDFDEDVQIDLGRIQLGGHLAVPANHSGVVIFAHGSGSSRHSPRNLFVAAELRKAGLATLLFDLLTFAEEKDRSNVFDIGLLARRLVAATKWIQDRPEVSGSRIGYFGASTGAAAALTAATDPSVAIHAIVSRGGRPDLAGPAIPRVEAPTLLIVGGADQPVLELNLQAAAMMRCPNRLWVVPDATHLFSEPGALQSVAELASAWFTDYLIGVDR
jgi:putative phosphoribosyl transferase